MEHLTRDGYQKCIDYLEAEHKELERLKRKQGGR